MPAPGALFAVPSNPWKLGEMIIGPAKVKTPPVPLTELVKIKTLGTGTFGRVKLVQQKHTKQVMM